MDENNGPELVQEDFSVYVAPSHAPAVADGELIARLEPSINIIGWPLGGAVVVAAMLYYRVRGIPWGRYRDTGLPSLPVLVAWVLLFLAIAAIVVLLATFYSGESSYYAELYGDRLVVRRGKQEWAAPLEEIKVIELVHDDSSSNQGPWTLALFDAITRVGGPRDFSEHAAPTRYLVYTSFDSTFPIPPFSGAEEFVTRVYQQRAARLKTMPPVVRGTEHDAPESEV